MKYKWLLIPLIGNMFEWYEFAIFSSLAGIIGALFFNSSDHFSATMFGFLIYGIAYAIRPLGTFIFGYIGDRYGRKKALSSSLLLMFFATLIIPFIPTYSVIGTTASYLLIFARLLQGISFGGEFSSVVTYTCETAPVGKKGLFSSLQIAIILVAIILGLLTVNILHSLYTDIEILAFAWKIPFFLAIIIGIFGLYVRSFSTETEEFLNIKKENKIVKNPFLYFFKNYYKEFFICMPWLLGVSAGVQTFTIGAKSTFEIIFNFNHTLSGQCGIWICLITIPFVLIGGFIVERFKLQKVRKFYTFTVLIASIIACYLLTKQSHILIFFGVLLMSVVVGIGNGIYPYYFYKNIPVEVRDTGVGFSIAIPAVIAGGFGMIILMKLFQKYSFNGIYIFIAAMNVILFIGLWLDFRYSRIAKLESKNYGKN